jgi:hypothetical protein
MNLKKIDTLLLIESGAPNPVVLSNEHSLFLLYYYQHPDENILNVLIPSERNVTKDQGIAIISFEIYIVYKFGYPNDEVLQAHPYYNLGLSPYDLFEVVGSEWIEKIEKMNRIHPYHQPARYLLFKHFIITFKDSTFECIARDLSVEFKPKITMQEGIKCVSMQITKEQI